MFMAGPAKCVSSASDDMKRAHSESAPVPIARHTERHLGL